MAAAVPTLYEWAGGAPALSRLTEAFYARVRADEVLAPVFAGMPPDHPEHVATWLGRGLRRAGPLHGGARRLPPHARQAPGPRARPEQRSRWVQLICLAADEAGLPADPEFRSAFVAYVEWGTRLALANSQPGARPAPVPRWGWGEAPPYTPSAEPKVRGRTSASRH